MKCVCRQDCQLRLEDGNKIVKKGGKITFIERGTILNLNECPSTFESLEAEEYALDFSTATEQELLKAKWTITEAKDAMKEIYGHDLKISSEDKKKDVVRTILDIRYRKMDA